jgi:enoyl-CoA hydratase/carnithine racemase
MGTAYLLPRMVGQGRALELLLLGNDVDARAAERCVRANRVVPQEQLMPAAREWAECLAQGPGLSLGMTKLMLNNDWDMDLVSAIEAQAHTQALMMMGEDHRAFYEGFREKRKNAKNPP